MYKISEASKLLNISKETLRYYDIENIGSSNRANNHYQYYDDEDIMLLQYIEVMKKYDLSLDEIKAILSNIKNNKNCYINNTIELLEKKKKKWKWKLRD